VGDVGLAVFAEVLAVGVDDGRGVVVDAGLVLFVDGTTITMRCFFGQLHHELRGRPLRDALREVVPLRLLLRAEVRP
jgi:hypothetical protein